MLTGIAEKVIELLDDGEEDVLNEGIRNDIIINTEEQELKIADDIARTEDHSKLWIKLGDPEGSKSHVENMKTTSYMYLWKMRKNSC